MSGTVVVVEGDVDTGVAELVLERLRAAPADEFVGGPEMAEDGAVDRVKSGLPWGMT